jgi:predicted small lipoprotein YifL
MRIGACLLLLVSLTGCGAEGGLPPLPADQVRARFPPGGVVNSIEIDAVNRLPLRTAELVAPDGQATPASYLHVDPSPGVTFYQRQIDTPEEGNFSGIGNFAPVPAVVAGAPQGDARFLAMVSNASIPLPDEIEYRRDWRSYRIFLSFGDVAGEVERRVLPAPEPPPKG